MKETQYNFNTQEDSLIDVGLYVYSKTLKEDIEKAESLIKTNKTIISHIEELKKKRLNIKYSD